MSLANYLTADKSRFVYNEGSFKEGLVQDKASIYMSNNHTVTGLSDPSTATEAANKEYVDTNSSDIRYGYKRQPGYQDFPLDPNAPDQLLTYTIGNAPDLDPIKDGGEINAMIKFNNPNAFAVTIKFGVVSSLAGSGSYHDGSEIIYYIPANGFVIVPYVYSGDGADFEVITTDGQIALAMDWQSGGGGPFTLQMAGTFNWKVYQGELVV